MTRDDKSVLTNRDVAWSTAFKLVVEGDFPLDKQKIQDRAVEDGYRQLSDKTASRTLRSMRQIGWVEFLRKGSRYNNPGPLAREMFGVEGVDPEEYGGD